MDEEVQKVSAFSMASAVCRSIASVTAAGEGGSGSMSVTCWREGGERAVAESLRASEVGEERDSDLWRSVLVSRRVG
jgi:hypothetical protein